MKKCNQVLYYESSHPNATIRYHASNMILTTDTYYAYFVLPTDHSCITGHYYFTNRVIDSYKGNPTPNDADNAENVMLRTGYVITYVGRPLSWYSKLQPKIALSTTEAEYNTLIQAMREVIPFIALMVELYYILDIHIINPEVFCKLFEDNQSCIDIAE